MGELGQKNLEKKVRIFHVASARSGLQVGDVSVPDTVLGPVNKPPEPGTEEDYQGG